MSSGSTAQDPTWTSKEQSEEARYAHEKETSQLAAIRERIREQESEPTNTTGTNGDAAPATKPYFERDFEGGHGGQEDLEDRYATTSGEH